MFRYGTIATYGIGLMLGQDMKRFWDDNSILQKDLDIMSLAGRAVFMDMMNHMKPDSERVAPDKRGCEIIFARTFVNAQMTWDFPLIARDFLKHECVNIENYKDMTYGDDKPQYSEVNSFWHRTLTHAMYQGAKQGSEYCIALLKYLFKTYYSKLYKSFKRFSSISAKEVVALSENEDRKLMDIYLISVILCMAEIHGVMVKEDCDVLYLMLDEKCKEQETLTSIEFLEFPDGLFEMCQEQIKEMFGTDSRKILRQKFEVEKFSYNALRYHGYPEKYIFFNMERDQNIIGELAKVLAILKMTKPGKEFTKEDILVHANIYEAINAFTYSVDNVYYNLLDALNLGDDTFYEDEDVWFEPEKVQPFATSKSHETPEVVKIVPVIQKDEREYSQEALLKEIDELRTKLHIMEQENKHLRFNLQLSKRLQEEQAGLAKELENSRQELAALRSHLYHFTEYDEQANVTDLNSMIEKISTKKVTIVGGHINWVQKMKKTFPSWNFISSSVSVSNDAKWISHSDFVYFFTDTLSHSVYNTFIQQVREKQVPFGYIHSVNIEANVKQMWEELIDN